MQTAIVKMYIEKQIYGEIPTALLIYMQSYTSLESIRLAIGNIYGPAFYFNAKQIECRFIKF